MAESIMRITLKKKSTGSNTVPEAFLDRMALTKKKLRYSGKQNEMEFLVQFDESINLAPMWIDASTLLLFRQNREEITYFPIQDLRRRGGVHRAVQKRVENTERYGFCHHCKQ